MTAMSEEARALELLEPSVVPGAAAKGGFAPVPAPEPRKKIPGIRKAAILMSQLQTETAGAVMAKLRSSELEMLSTEIMRLRAVDTDDAIMVMDEFHEMLQARMFVGQGGMDFAREALIASLGPERAEEILGRLNVVYREMPFASLRNADPRQIATFLKDEHPQIIAVVLSHLQPQQAAEVMARLQEEQAQEVAYRIATLERSDSEIIHLIETELTRRIGSVLAHQDMANIGGVSALVEVINRSDRSTERSILEWLATQDEELAERVRSQMFVFEDIVNLDNRSVQKVLAQSSPVELALALKGVSDVVRDKVESNMSESGRVILREEADLLGAVRAREVEEMQAKIVQSIRSLEEQGEITISRSGEDELVS